ncbi:expressed unknown protein [Seminavis robusta]|uniref:Calcineurin-like phosphoesterase domain-containing protein n=1 Tax=Seminavis robusta TaxID=568900 RepID=A0A9N8EPP2_9STRA|nr:expressed unknown protein [Seminavis robusta]|eukprot:Sro1616_g286250.1 n/a (493) ;mRNA; f:15663-17141
MMSSLWFAFLCVAVFSIGAFLLPPSSDASLRRRLNSTVWREDPLSHEAEEDKPFTIIFVSDLENRYRGHDIRRSQYVVNYIKNLKDSNLVFNQPYSDIFIKPKLVIHGGDISHQWSCNGFKWFILGGCRNAQDEYKDVWDRLYKAGIPMISAYGNHDWNARDGTGNPWGSETDQPRDENTDFINRWSNEFTTLSYEKSAKLTNGNLEYEEFYPTGDIGQSMFRATYGGIQIVNFNSAFNWQSYDRTDNGMVYDADDQFERLSRSLDRNMKTIFFEHYPLNKGGSIGSQSPSRNTALSLIREFGEGVAHFSGHFHVNRVYPYTAAEPNFNDYVAPYPHIWNGNEPGFLAILMSRTQGVLQVKTLDIPGLEDGDKCMPFNYVNIREAFFGFWPETNDWFKTYANEERPNEDGGDESSAATPRDNSLGSNGANELGRGTISDATRCCNTCKSGKQSWSGEVGWFVCGQVDDEAEARLEEIIEVPELETWSEESTR